MVVELEGMPIAVARAEDVIIAELEWASLGETERQIGDAAGILRVRSGELDLGYIERWVRELRLEAQCAAATERREADNLSLAPAGRHYLEQAPVRQRRHVWVTPRSRRDIPWTRTFETEDTSMQASRSAISFGILVLQVSGCAGWHRVEPNVAARLKPSAQVQVWRGDSTDVLHGVVLTPDSVSGIPYFRPLACDSCRRGRPLAQVDGLRVGNRERAGLMLVGIPMAALLGFSTIMAEGMKGA